MNETARKLVHAKVTIACLRKRIKKLEGEIAGLKHVAAGIGFNAHTRSIDAQ